MIRQIPKVRASLKTFKPDVLHALRVQNEGYLAAFTRPYDFIVSSWGSDFGDSIKYSPIDALLTKATMRRAAAFFSDCQRDQHLAVKFGLRPGLLGNVMAGNGGVWDEDFHPKDPLCRTPTVLYCRGVSRLTRLDTLFAAIASLQSGACEQVRLTVVAPVEVHKHFRDLTRDYGLDPSSVTLCPHTAPQQLGQIMREHTVFVSPMLSDGTPNSMLEAMACGMIPVMSDLESVREHVTHGINGYLFDPKSHNSLRAALMQAFDATDGSFRAANVGVIRTHFNYENTMARVLSIYEDVSSNQYTFEEIQAPSTFEAQLRQHGEGSIFVGEAWLGFTCTAVGGRFIGLRIRNSAGLTGFFAGVLFRRLGLKIIGSPFPGWGTSYMGVCGQLPLNHQLVSSLLAFLFKRHGAHYIEMVNPPGEHTLASCAGYSVSHLDSLLLPLADGLDQLYARLKGDCRTYLRQFNAKGGTVAAVAPNRAFAEGMYDQLIEVFARQGMVPTHSRQRITAMLAALDHSQVDLLCLQASGPTGEALASSVFFGANGVFYYWACASYSSAHKFRPSEAMIWEAIRHFCGLGYQSFDMMGVRDYKLKFSPHPVSYTRIFAARPAFLIHLRDLAQRTYYVFNRFLGLATATRGTRTARLSSNLILNALEPHEFAHYQSDDLCIYTDANVVCIKGASEHRITLPLSLSLQLLSLSRIVRRLTRLDCSCVIPTGSGLIIFWQYSVYHWSEAGGLIKTMTTPGSRNPMHNSTARINELTYVFGEYGNPRRGGKKVYKTTDGGLSWTVAFNFLEGSIRHVHSCVWDPHAQLLWIFTGDFDGECKVISATTDFNSIRYYGDGSQIYRATGAFIDTKYVHWIMDSPTQAVRQVSLNKKTGEITLGHTFAGPVYYYTLTRDGIYLVCTAQEPGVSLVDTKVHLYASRNLKKWVDIGVFEKDFMPMRLFRFGVGVFPNGDFGSEDVMLSCEAVKVFDGRVARLCVKGI